MLEAGLKCGNRKTGEQPWQYETKNTNFVSRYSRHRVYEGVHFRLRLNLAAFQMVLEKKKGFPLTDIIRASSADATSRLHSRFYQVNLFHWRCIRSVECLSGV